MVVTYFEMFLGIWMVCGEFFFRFSGVDGEAELRAREPFIRINERFKNNSFLFVAVFLRIDIHMICF